MLLVALPGQDFLRCNPSVLLWVQRSKFLLTAIFPEFKHFHREAAIVRGNGARIHSSHSSNLLYFRVAISAFLLVKLVIRSISRLAAIYKP